MRVIGTAGHVDHGKSTLIHALTGIDPDRLIEEKERGMTIDLGFAWLTLPSGREVSIVDVPGHERFIHNMLAGVGGIDIALLVVAADEGIMPQTREHLGILDLLHIPNGIVVITKRDLVDEEWLDLVIAEVAEAVAGTAMERAPVVAVSAVSGEGMPELVALIEQQLANDRARPNTGKPRLPIDRVFTIPGFGTVVTGTLIDGELRVGQDVEIQPGGRRTRIRGLQSHKRKLERASGGSRVAVNVVGVATDELTRGQVLSAVGVTRPTRVVDVKLRVLDSAPKALPHNVALTFHTGAAETTAKAALLDSQRLEPGSTGWAQLRLGDEVAVMKGDLFVVRLPSPSITVGGGVVVEPHPRRHRRFQERVLERLAVLEQGSPAEILVQQLQAREPCELNALIGRTSISADETRELVHELLANGDVVGLEDGASAPGPRTLLISAGGWQRLSGDAADILGAYHEAHRLRRGIPKEELRTRLGLDARVFARVLARLSTDDRAVEVGPFVALPDHRVELTGAEEQAARQMLLRLRAGHASPPTRDELEATYRLTADLTQALIDRGDIVEVSSELVYDRGTYDGLVEAIKGLIATRGPITVATVRDHLDTSRRYALALLAHLDEARVTRRVGDERVLF
ncbi:MAG: selenocysteine-specific translation elongation factor [Chloroflexota bacterium]